MVDYYKDLADNIWSKMVNLIGVHTVMVLVQRAVWITGQNYDEAKSIQFNKEGITFQFEGVERGRAKAVFEEFIASLVEILTRLVGRDIVQRIIEIDDTIKSRGIQ
ncbi:MAG: hypothetical protein AB1500_06955 [Bacillota bacterium]